MKGSKGWIPLVALAVSILLLPWVRGVTGFPVSYLVLLTAVLFWTAQATSWNILSGYSGYFSFGQGAFYGVGVYTMAVLTGRQGQSWWIGMLLGGALALILALFIGTIAFRLRSLRGEVFALLTLAIPFILAAVARVTDAIDGGQGIILPVPGYPGFLGPFQQFIFLLSGAVAVLALVAAYLMQRTRYGWALFAIHDAEDVAEGLGVPTFRHKMIAIGANGLIAGLSGAVNALQIGFVSPEGTFNLRVPLFVIVMSVLGGRLFWAGPMVGAVYIVTIQNRLAGGFEGWSLIILGTVLVLLVLFAPEGLMARFVRRPWTVVGVITAVIAVLAIYGAWGDPVTWLAVALGAAGVVAMIPGATTSGRTTSKASGRLGAALVDPNQEGIPPPEIGRPVVEVDSVSKRFGGIGALRGVSMTVFEGEIVGLVGPNGSGKTTLVNLMAGTLAPTSGSIAVDGVDIARMAPHEIAHHGIARTYQIPKPFNSMTVRDNVVIAIMFGRDRRGLDASRVAAEEALALVGLTELGDARPGEINLHERQLLEMARAMATKPAVLLLDEALAGLNPVEIDNAVAVVRRIHRSGVSIVLVEHLLRVVNQLATRIVVLDQGKQLAGGAPTVVMRDPAVVSAYLGSEAHAPGE
ncbi:MAG TPA: branched-chain amino acid ABC transporter ATP-binding protein/permease [Acidimicrobiia bacterium]|nr:branched-chain amino acid ABC transporter ATP-binding protein/permease [Acidimicrobiia bacterium]